MLLPASPFVEFMSQSNSQKHRCLQLQGVTQYIGCWSLEFGITWLDSNAFPMLAESGLQLDYNELKNALQLSMKDSLKDFDIRDSALLIRILSLLDWNADEVIDGDDISRWLKFIGYMSCGLVSNPDDPDSPSDVLLYMKWASQNWRSVRDDVLILGSRLLDTDDSTEAPQKLLDLCDALIEFCISTVAIGTVDVFKRAATSTVLRLALQKAPMWSVIESLVMHEEPDDNDNDAAPRAISKQAFVQAVTQTEMVNGSLQALKMYLASMKNCADDDSDGEGSDSDSDDEDGGNPVMAGLHWVFQQVADFDLSWQKIKIAKHGTTDRAGFAALMKSGFEKKFLKHKAVFLRLIRSQLEGIMFGHGGEMWMELIFGHGQDDASSGEEDSSYEPGSEEHMQAAAAAMISGAILRVCAFLDKRAHTSANYTSPETEDTPAGQPFAGPGAEVPAHRSKVWRGALEQILQVRERDTAFPCAAAAILPKTDAFACGAAASIHA